MELEACADEIVNDILSQAIKASEVVARQTIENGDYEIGINIPSLYIRRRVVRMDVSDYRASEMATTRTVKRIDV